MAKIRIQSACPHCGVESPPPAGFPHRLTPDGRIVCMVRWDGVTPDGQALRWEGPAGMMPNKIQYPAVLFMPAYSYCPNCLTMFHVGPALDQDSLDDEPGPVIATP